MALYISTVACGDWDQSKRRAGNARASCTSRVMIEVDWMLSVDMSYGP